MTETCSSLLANGVHIDTRGYFSLTPAALEILPLVADSHGQDEIRRDVNKLVCEYAEAVRMLTLISRLTATMRRAIGIKAPLYKRLVEGQKERVWTLADLKELQNLRCGKSWLIARAEAEKALKEGKLSEDEYVAVENFLGSGSYGLIDEFGNIPADAKGDIKRANFEQSFLNKKGKYDSVAIYCLVKPIGKKWKIIHAEYPDACASKHVGRTKLTHGLCFY